MSDKNPPQLRLRVFAGPNGSGKSTVIKEIRETEVRENRKLDVGIYINADDIAQKLKSGKFTFDPYNVKGTHTELVDFAKSQGLLYGGVTETEFSGSFRIDDKKLILDNHSNLDRVAQVIARFLRHALIAAKKRFSFETVFSHDSNLADMRLAAENGYKVYFYFVGTESAEINKYRVALRVSQGGHDVPPERIEDRWLRSMRFLYDAAEISYQSFFFDNSVNDQPYRLTGHFKVVAGEKEWDEIPKDRIAFWFRKYYQARQKNKI